MVMKFFGLGGNSGETQGTVAHVAQPEGGVKPVQAENLAQNDATESVAQVPIIEGVSLKVTPDKVTETKPEAAADAPGTTVEPAADSAPEAISSDFVMGAEAKEAAPMAPAEVTTASMDMPDPFAAPEAMPADSPTEAATQTAAEPTVEDTEKDGDAWFSEIAGTPVIDGGEPLAEDQNEVVPSFSTPSETSTSEDVQPEVGVADSDASVEPELAEPEAPVDAKEAEPASIDLDEKPKDPVVVKAEDVEPFSVPQAAEEEPSTKVDGTGFKFVGAGEEPIDVSESDVDAPAPERIPESSDHTPVAEATELQRIADAHIEAISRIIESINQARKDKKEVYAAADAKCGETEAEAKSVMDRKIAETKDECEAKVQEARAERDRAKAEADEACGKVEDSGNTQLEESKAVVIDIEKRAREAKKAMKDVDVEGGPERKIAA